MNEIFQKMFETHSAVMLLIDPDTGDIVNANSAAASFYGYSVDMLCQMKITVLNQLPPDQVYRNMQKAKTRKANYFVFPHRIKTGELLIIESYSSPVEIENKTLLFSIIHDITERIKSENELRKNQLLFNETSRIAKLGGWEIDVDTEKVAWTEEVYRIHEVESDYKPVLKETPKFYAEKSKLIIEYAIQKAIEDGEPFELELQFITAKGNHRWVHTKGKPYQENGKTIKISGTFQDITERRLIEDALRESEAKYRHLFDAVPVGIGVADYDGNILDINSHMLEMMGYTPDEIKQINVKDTYANHRERIQLINALKQNIRLRDWDVKLKQKNGTIYDALLNVEQTEIKGEKRILTIARDITERKKQKELLKATLAEKETLLREIHHRVKNNLQSLIYLIDMQADAVDNPEITKTLSDLQGRAKAMALVHEKLYQSDDLAEIDFGRYIEELAATQFHALRGDKAISLHTDAANIKLGINLAIPCGLIINELITNAIKYAFPTHQDFRVSSHSQAPALSRPQTPALSRSQAPAWERGEIRVKFDFQDGKYMLMVSDNGIGLSPQINWRTTKSLGLKLVNIWAKYQLKGSIDVNTENGATFVIRF